jgi:hypothetical protein
MGRKPATVGKGGSTTREKIRERKKRDPSIPIEIKVYTESNILFFKTISDQCFHLQVKKVTGVDESRSSILAKLGKTTKDTFASDLLNDKVVSFLTKDAGSTMYPKLMREIKTKASKLGVKIPDRSTADVAHLTPAYRNNSPSLHPLVYFRVAAHAHSHGIPAAILIPLVAVATGQVRVRGQGECQAARGARRQDRRQGRRRRRRRRRARGGRRRMRRPPARGTTTRKGCVRTRGGG